MKEAIVAAVAEASRGFQTISPANIPPSREVVLDSIFYAAGKLRLISAGNVLGNMPGISWDKAHRIRFADTVAGHMLQKGFVVRPLDDDVTAPWPDYVAIDTIADMVTKKSLPLDYVCAPWTTPRIDEIVREGLDKLSTSVVELDFETHESDGTLPLAVKTVNMRNLVRAAQAAAPRSVAPRPPRHVNASFFRPDAWGKDVCIAQRSARLSPGEEVHLGIRVGAKDRAIATIGDLVLFEEPFPWSSGADGCWLEIGVTPMDFDNLGAPVQEVWLPREGEMQRVTFALSPRAETAVPGVARVRFTLYYQNNVVQSFRVAALLAMATGDTAADLARALGTDPKDVPADTGYLARLEYSAASPTQGDTLAARSLSIVANRSAGQKVFTIKGDDFFSSTINSDIADMVQAARDALRDASVNDLEEYRYDRTDNCGKSAELIDRTMQAARRGWELYAQILPDQADRKDVAGRLGDEGVITAAHIDLEHVVPWSLIYDQPVDDAHTEEDVEVNGVWKTYDVARAVCPAGLPAADGSLPPGDCGTRADCLLHGADEKQRKIVGDVMYCRDRVVCLRRFWGFAHQIEVPAQQTQPQQGEEQEPARRIAKIIPAGNPAAVVVGFNPAAPSRFIAQFIQSRHASAVIGTEVTVWEELASEMGSLFLTEFLGVGQDEEGRPREPKSAGLALVRARRRLLHKHNPLGLVYTLYGSADLHIVYD
jgi:hypothetical protein